MNKELINKKLNEINSKLLFYKHFINSVYGYGNDIHLDKSYYNKFYKLKKLKIRLEKIKKVIK